MTTPNGQQPNEPKLNTTIDKDIQIGISLKKGQLTIQTSELLTEIKFDSSKWNSAHIAKWLGKLTAEGTYLYKGWLGHHTHTPPTALASGTPSRGTP